jgi:predicted HD phosphohydrolase
MLKLTSRFVLQVLPYLLMALAAVVLLPGVADSLIAAALRAASSPPHEIGTIIEPFGHREATLDLIRQDHEALAPNGLLREIAKAADFEDR